MAIFKAIRQKMQARREIKNEAAVKRKRYEERSAAFAAPNSKARARAKKAIEFIQRRAQEQVQGHGKLKNEFDRILREEHDEIFNTINERMDKYRSQLEMCPKGTARYRFLEDLIARLGSMKLYAMVENERTFHDEKVEHLKRNVGDAGRQHLISVYALKYAFHQLGLVGAHWRYLEKIDQVAEDIKKSPKAEKMNDESVRKGLSNYLFYSFRHYFKNKQIARRFVDTYLQSREALSN